MNLLKIEQENSILNDNSKIPLIQHLSNGPKSQEHNNDCNSNENFNDHNYPININSTDNFDETNVISTSKYKWYNCFPKILIEQFSKMANIYFLLIAIMQVNLI
jgi:hypothetical protein